MDTQLRCILVGGTSNVGKSTLARAWADELGWPLLSTDQLGRHPGRPWPAGGRGVPPHVAEHYLGHGDQELLASVLEHYHVNIWPLATNIINAIAAAPQGRLVLEGSGCWPDLVLRLNSPHIAAMWVTGTPEMIASRIRRESRYDAADVDGRRLIERFIARSQLFDVAMRERLQALGLVAVKAAEQEDMPALLERSRAALRRLG